MTIPIPQPTTPMTEQFRVTVTQTWTATAEMLIDATDAKAAKKVALATAEVGIIGATVTGRHASAKRVPHVPQPVAAADDDQMELAEAGPAVDPASPEEAQP